MRYDEGFVDGLLHAAGLARDRVAHCRKSERCEPCVEAGVIAKLLDDVANAAADEAPAP